MSSMEISPKIMVLVIISISVLVISGCTSPRSSNSGSDDFQIELHKPGQIAVGTMDLMFEVLDSSGNPVESATVNIVGDMSHAGMKSVHARTRDMGSGQYITEDFEFTMAGDWILTATVEKGDLKASRIFKINGITGQ